MKFDRVKEVVQFIQSITEKFGIPHPAPLHGRSARPPVFLPAHMTFVALHKDYIRDCSTKPVSLTIFREIWHDCMPHIKFMTPRTDVCDTCERLRSGVNNAVGEDETLDADQKLREHIFAAQEERDLYRAATLAAKDELEQNEAVVPPCPPCSNPLHYTHYTFDFAPSMCPFPSATGKLGHCTLKCQGKSRSLV